MLGGSQISPPTTTEYIHYLPRGLRIILSQSVPATWICPIATGLPIWLYHHLNNRSGYLWFWVPEDRIPSTIWNHFVGNILLETYPDLEIQKRCELDEIPDQQLHQLEAIQSGERNFLSEYTKYDCIFPRVWHDLFQTSYLVEAYNDNKQLKWCWWG